MTAAGGGGRIDVGTNFFSSPFLEGCHMSPDVDSLTSQVLALPLEQRVELAQRLWQSLEGQLDEDEELFAEIARRDAEIESGSVKPIPYDEAMRDIRESLQ
jgi:putative addiction module component (TIGR02574 family)